ncbi:MAG: hypothetical protein WCA78_15350 [Rhizomicrobium sp.]
MKIVLSRKGFDSANGGVPNPILPGGILIPLPIPASRDPHTYDDIAVKGVSLGPLVEELTGGKYKRTHRCHLDPDLDAGSLPRTVGWRPAFGQIGAAQSHLARHAIGKGDLFLFFGWFREAEQVGGRWKFIRRAPNLHVIYGWMQVDEVISLANARGPTDRLAAFADHPHLHGRSDPSNTLYLAAERLDLPHLDGQGGGIFREVSAARILTDVHQSKRSTWKLPAWFHPERGATLSYHENSDRWQIDGTECSLSSAARGQEFVLTTTDSEATEVWLRDIFGGNESARKNLGRE